MLRKLDPVTIVVAGRTLTLQRPGAIKANEWTERSAALARVNREFTAALSAAQASGDTSALAPPIYPHLRECIADIASGVTEVDGVRTTITEAELDAELTPDEVVGAWVQYYSAARVGADERGK